MNDDLLMRLGCLLERPDRADLHGYRRVVGRSLEYGRSVPATVAERPCSRGRITTQHGKPDRRSSVFLPLVTRWAQRHYMVRDGAL